MTLSEFIPVIDKTHVIHISNPVTKAHYRGTVEGISDEFKNLCVKNIEADDFHSIYITAQEE